MRPHTSVSDSAGVFAVRHDLRPGDLGHIIALHGRVHAREYNANPTLEAEVAGQLAEFVLSKKERSQLWLAERGGRLAGCLGVVNLSPRDAQIRWFLIEPHARWTGLPERLLRDAVNYCRRCRYEHVFMWVLRATEQTTRWYQSAGFVKVEQRPAERWGIRLIEERYVLQALLPEKPMPG
jgi:N-acetylglutamate synthase-like GNAT family acetyltransferase